MRTCFKGHNSDIIFAWGLERESVFSHYFNKLGVFYVGTMKNIILHLFYDYLKTGKYIEKQLLLFYKDKFKKEERIARKEIMKKNKTHLKPRLKQTRLEKKAKKKKKEFDIQPLFIGE